MTEDGAQTLLEQVARQAAQDWRSRRGVNTRERLEAWEFLRHIGLDRRSRQRLLQEARDAASYTGCNR